MITFHSEGECPLHVSKKQKQKQKQKKTKNKTKAKESLIQIGKLLKTRNRRAESNEIYLQGENVAFF